MPGYAAHPHEVRDLEPRRRSRPLLRLLLVGIALLGLARPETNGAVSALLPLARAEIAALDRNIDISALAFEQTASGSLVRLDANLIHPFEWKGHVIEPLGWRSSARGWYRIELAAGAVLQTPLVFLIVLLSWPQATPRELLARAAVGMPFGMLLFALDTPLLLLGNFQQEVVRAVDPMALRPLFLWDRFLEGGGGFALGLALAAVCLSLARRDDRAQGGVT
jgi:hypothetical protein